MAASANPQLLHISFCSQRHRCGIPNFFGSRRPSPFSRGVRVFGSISGSKKSHGLRAVCCVSRDTHIGKVAGSEENERRPFDINLAVILAGFAFEAYSTPPESVGRQEMDAAGCKTVYLSETFVREIYDGQLFIKLKKGFSFPALDPWGTSDPYIVMQLGGQVVKSKVKWGKKDPTWNEEFVLNTKLPPLCLQIAAWDANLVTPHKRMGNAGVNFECYCDGNVHELLVELEGMGGGGRIQLEVKYKSFDEIEEDKRWWTVPFVSEFLRKNGLDTALKKLVGSDTVQVSQFVQYAFSQLKSLNDNYVQKDWFSNNSKHDMEGYKDNSDNTEDDSLLLQGDFPEVCSANGSSIEGVNLEEVPPENSGVNDVHEIVAPENGGAEQSNKHFWKDFADAVAQNVGQRFGKSIPVKIKWDGIDALNKIGMQLGKIADDGYIESGLAIPGSQYAGELKESGSGPLNVGRFQSSLPVVKKATEDLLRQTDSIFGALMVLAAAVPPSKRDLPNIGNFEAEESGSTVVNADISGSLKSEQFTALDARRAEEMKALFSTAESAMEAWAMLATSLGHPSFIKSEFEKICFLDNNSTDTQVAIWRDSIRKKLVVAFRGTEQVRWKDLRTDLMLAPAGLNPERIGGDFKQEVQVHSGFLSAYDSVRTRIISLIQQAVGDIDDGAESPSRWHVYATGHSLGGALATLLALELSSSQLAKRGSIYVTMYNFGSPRVGNRRFAEIYNEKVKDSWRVVNHRDIIPTIPRLMGYCHVAQPVYLAAGDLAEGWGDMGPLDDGYDGDVIGELTPDIIVGEFLKGEKELVERILQTEINIFRSIRDGSALMQHMEDFYYISLLENVRTNCQIASMPQNQDNSSSIS